MAQRRKRRELFCPEDAVSFIAEVVRFSFALEGIAAAIAASVSLVFTTATPVNAFFVEMS